MRKGKKQKLYRGIEIFISRRAELVVAEWLKALGY